MENFDDFENKSYEKARIVKYQIHDFIKFIVIGLMILIKIAVILILDLLKCFIELFISPKPKNISGQLALVTGSSFIL